MKINSKLSGSFLSASKMCLLFLLIFLLNNPIHSQPPAKASGWYFTNYSFKDESLRKESVLMGTTTKIYDTIHYKGDKGNIVISQKRYDLKTGKLLAGVTYNVIWTDPPVVLKPDIKTSVNYELKTTSSLSWKAPQQSIHVDQGLYGIYYITTGGIKYIKKDIREKLTTEKPILKGTKGAKRVIQVNLGNGFHAVYTYEWR